MTSRALGRRLKRRTGEPCSHVWVDPDDPPIQRAPHSTVIGLGRREMKPDHLYICRNCGEELKFSGVD